MTKNFPFKIKLFFDGAELEPMRLAYDEGFVKGFTTNPTLMRGAGIKNYEVFAKAAIDAIPDLPISFEVFSDEFDQMEREARIINSWGGDTYIKIPITNTLGESSLPLIQKLSEEGISLNVTAIMTVNQVSDLARVINPNTRTIVSVFAGRIADTGVDPVPMMAEAVSILKGISNAELLWASPRELLNLFQAEACGCHIITATSGIISKVPMIGKNLEEYSLETVKMFYEDALKAGYCI